MLESHIRDTDLLKQTHCTSNTCLSVLNIKSFNIFSPESQRSTMICGGMGTPSPATPEIQAVCDQVKPHIEEKLGQKLDKFEAKSFTSQVSYAAHW